ncbi:MAG: hypothetical protein HOI95_00015 [Chromatiales bacterium]|jgi:hypothetical protein|nr:hypothetical protein [Chromatiales bacterium]
MNFFKDEPPSRPPEDVLEANLLDALWEDYCRTGERDYLTLFIRRGGDIGDQETRNIIADLIDSASKNPGGKTVMANIRFYRGVCKLMDYDKMKKTKAIELLADVEGTSVEAGWSRYRSGEKLENC